MQNQQTRKWTFSRVVAVIGVILLLMATSFMAYNAVDEQARVSTFR